MIQLDILLFRNLQGISISHAASYIDLSALAILFSFMIISAQFIIVAFIHALLESWKIGIQVPPTFF